DLFQGEKYGCKRRVKRCSNGRCRANRDQGLHFFLAQAKFPAQDRRDARAYLHRRTFTAERNAAGKGRRSAKEFSKDGAQRDAAFSGIERGFALWDTAAARVRKIPIEQEAHDE